MNLVPNFNFKYRLGEDSFEFPLIVFLDEDNLKLFSFADGYTIGSLPLKTVLGCVNPPYIEKHEALRRPYYKDDVSKAIEVFSCGKFDSEILDFILFPQIDTVDKKSSLKESIVKFISKSC